MAQAETTKTKVYQEGNYGVKLFKIQNDGTYGAAYSVAGLTNVDITFSRTVTNTAADDVVDYLTRRSPEKGEGTITFLGLSLKDYKAMYNDIVDSNNVLVVGKKNATAKVGMIFYNHEESAEGTSENMFVFPNVSFELPNISTQTIQEDDTTIRPFEIPVTLNPKNFGTGATANRYTYAIVNSEDNKDIYNSVKDTIYIPNQTVSA